MTCSTVNVNDDDPQKDNRAKYQNAVTEDSDDANT
jgi:hypothetical protein